MSVETRTEKHLRTGGRSRETTRNTRDQLLRPWGRAKTHLNRNTCGHENTVNATINKSTCGQYYRLPNKNKSNAHVVKIRCSVLAGTTITAALIIYKSACGRNITYSNMSMASHTWTKPKLTNPTRRRAISIRGFRRAMMVSCVEAGIGRWDNRVTSGTPSTADGRFRLYYDPWGLVRITGGVTIRWCVITLYRFRHRCPCV